LSLLFGLLCYLTMALGLAWRTRGEAAARLAQPLPTTPATTIPFLGINVALEQFSPLERTAALRRLQQSGFGWVRQRLDWGQLEPTPGVYQWTVSDDLLAAITAADLIPVIVLDGSPAWARRPQDVGAHDNPFAPPADPQTFAAFAGVFAARYSSSLRFYQIWDEPNLAPHWGHQYVEPVAYAQLLKAAAAAIRAADPDAVILTAALAPTADRGHTAVDEVYFLQRLYAAGAAPFFDAVAIQLYGFGTSPGDPRAQIDVLNFQRAKLIRRVMLAAGDEATPIWAVRYGWNTRPNAPWGTVESTTQQHFARQALELTWQEWPWLAALAWHSDQPNALPADPVWGFALTPELAAGFRQWHISTGVGIRSFAPPPYSSAPLLLWMSALLVTLWRARAALGVLPWRAWALCYQRWRWPVRGGLWLALTLLYYFATWPPLIVLCWLASALLIAAQPVVGLALLAVVLPLPFQHKELQMVDSIWRVAPAHALLLGLLPALIGHGARRLALERTSRVWPRLTWTDPLALGWLGLSLGSASGVWHWPAYGEGMCELVLAPLLGYLAVRCFVRSSHHLRWMVVALTVGGLCVAVSGLLDWALGGGTVADGVRRLVGPYFSANHTALYLVRVLFVSVGLALAATAHVRRGWLVVSFCITLALLGTVSRGAWLLGVPTGLAVLSWWFVRQLPLTRDRARTLFRVAVLCAGGSGFVILGLGWLGWERLTNSATVVSRWQIWQATLQLWQEFPLLGVGPGGFFWRYPAYLNGPSVEPNILHPHNVWLEIGAGWGLVGLLWFALLLWGLLRQVRWAAGITEVRFWWILAGLAAGWLAGLAHAQVDAFLTLPDLAAWNWLVLGLLVQGKCVQSNP
jgi:O-antigen ligase